MTATVCKRPALPDALPTAARPAAHRWAALEHAVGLQLSRRRTARGWRLVDLAARIARDGGSAPAPRTLGRYERGDTRMPVAAAARISRALEVELGTLVDRAWRAVIGIDAGRPLAVDLGSLTRGGDAALPGLRDWAARSITHGRLALVDRPLARELARSCGIADHQLLLTLLDHLWADTADDALRPVDAPRRHPHPSATGPARTFPAPDLHAPRDQHVPGRLPATPPCDSRALRGLLDRECRDCLTLDGRPKPAVHDLVTAVATSSAPGRIGRRSTVRAGLSAAWTHQHHAALSDAVHRAATAHDHDLVVDLVPRLLLLTPPGLPHTWCWDLAAVAARAANHARRPHDLAVALDLAAHWLADTGAPGAQDLIVRATRLVITAAQASEDRTRVVAQLWRLTRLQARHRDLRAAAQALQVITHELRTRPDRRQSATAKTALGEVLLADGRAAEALIPLADAAALYELCDSDPTATPACVDARILLGHAHHTHTGADQARYHWRKALARLQAATPDTATASDRAAALEARVLHVRRLLASPPHQPPRRSAEFTVLGLSTTR